MAQQQVYSPRTNRTVWAKQNHERDTVVHVRLSSRELGWLRGLGSKWKMTTSESIRNCIKGSAVLEGEVA